MNAPAMHDTAAERIVLGAMMLDLDTVDVVAERLTSGDYYEPVHGLIHTVLVDLANAGRPTDPVVVADELDRRGDLGRLHRFGATYLSDLVSQVPIVASVGHHCGIVVDWSRRRRAFEATIRATHAVADLAKPVDDVLDEAAQAIHRAAVGDDHAGSVSLDDIADVEWQHLLDVAAGKVQPGIRTGFEDLDRLLGGWFPGQLVIVAGRPGMGKSALAMDHARAAAHAGHPVLAYTLEMPVREVQQRLWSAEARVPLHCIRQPGGLRDDDWQRISAARDRIRAWPLFLDDSTSTPARIAASARRFVRAHGGCHTVIIVDYLQRLTLPAAERRDLAVGDAATGLKTLARDLGATVIAVAQLNRGPEQRTDKRPTKADLRDSGQLEQEADVVVLVHRDDYYDKEHVRSGEADLIVDKHRNGPTDTVTVANQLHFARFVDMAIG